MQGQGLPAKVRWPVAAALAALGLWAIVAGGARLAALAGALSAGTQMVTPDSAVPAVPLLGVALVVLAVLVALPPAATSRLPAMLFAAFLLSGALAIGALVAGPWIVDRAMAAGGYRRCAVGIGIRVERSAWVREKAPCPVAARRNFPD